MSEPTVQQLRSCKRCLMREYDEAEYDEKLKEIIKAIPQEEKADDELYSERLNICKSCGQLTTGTCFVCGCYVEMRAAKKTNSCPRKKW